MTAIFKKTARFLGRFLLASFAFVFVALIAVQLILIVGINIVSTGKSSDFIAGKINEAITDSGYKVGFDALYYDPVRGFTLYGLSVSDSEGAFLSLDHFSFSISLALSPARTLGLSGSGGTLDLSRIPASTEEESQESKKPLTPFETPDIYFKTIVLSNLSFDRVDIGKSVAGKAYTLSPSLRARLKLDQDIGLSFTLKPGMPDVLPGLSAPEIIGFEGAMTPSTLAFSLNNFTAQTSSYILTMKGTGSFSDDGTLNLEAKAEHRDLSQLTGSILRAATAQISVAGPIAGPALDLSALLVTESLKERGLSDITLSLKTADISDGMKGFARIETSFKDEPVTLESSLSYEAPILHFTDMKGNAPDLTLAGGGVFSTKTSLFDGTLSLVAENLARYKELSGFALAGKLKADATLKSSDDAKQSADISASVTNGVFDTVKVKIFSARASFPSLSTPWPQSAKVESSGLQMAENVTLDKITAVIAQGSEQSYKLSLNGAGRAPHALSFDGSAMLSGLTQTIPAARDIMLNIRQGGTSAKLSGDFTQEEMDLAITAQDVRGQDLPFSLPDQLKELRIDVDATMKGTPAKPQSALNATLRGIASGAYENASVSLKADHNGENVTAALTGQGTGIRTLKANASFPMGLSLLPFHFAMDPSAPLTGTFALDADLAAIAPLFIPPTQTLSGNLTGDGTIAGTISDPLPIATLRLDSVNFNDQQNGIVVADLKAAAKITRDSLILSSLSATDGKDGTLNGSGTASFSGDAANIGLRLNNFNIPQSDLADGIISAELSLKGSGAGLHLAGKADIVEMNVLIPENFSSHIPQLNIIEDQKDMGPGLLERLALDITIDANNKVFVRGWGLDAEFGGDIAITGTASNPQFNGALSARRGRYEEFGKRFTLARADLRFQGDVPPSPYLDIEATTPAGDVMGSILLTGPVKSPSIKFASTPSLPEDEVLSRILFGKESTKISPFQAVQLAQALRRFSGQAGGSNFDPLGLLRSATGLDDLSVETDSTGAANVGAGKYLSDNVYLEVSKGKAENSGEATIQIEVTPSVKIESQIGQDAQGGGGIFWKHDY